jgi:hypothetical protein
MIAIAADPNGVVRINEQLADVSGPLFIAFLGGAPTFAVIMLVTGASAGPPQLRSKLPAASNCRTCGGAAQQAPVMGGLVSQPASAGPGEMGRVRIQI